MLFISQVKQSSSQNRKKYEGETENAFGKEKSKKMR